MKNTQFSLLMMLLLTCLLAGSKCKDSESSGNGKCDPGECDAGFECIDGNCACPPGKLSYGGNCIALSGDTYVGFASTCFCYDTLALAILGTGQDRVVQMPVIINGAVGSASTNAQYFNLSSGDSLYVLQLPLRCSINGTTPAFPEAFGKFQSDGSLHLDLTFRHADTGEVLGDCSLNLKKP